MPDPTDVALAFDDAINAADLEALVDLMTEDHRFVDSADHVVEGREACRRAWRGFFDAFPGYANHVERSVVSGDRVALAGRSVRHEPALTGPTLWTAHVVGERVAEWRVLDDTPENRDAVGLS